MEERIRKYALANAVKFKGKANAGAIIGKLIGENPELKKDMKQLSVTIDTILKEINALSLSDQKKELTKFGATEKKVLEKRSMFSHITVAHNKKLISCFPPEPSKYPHIGHAKAIIVNSELAKEHSGTFILRFEDTNPTLVKQEFYDIHLDNYRWLGVKADEIVYASDYMAVFYEHLGTLLKTGNAYVDRASQDEIKTSRMKGIPTKDRSNSPDENILLWESMKMMDEGSAVVRLKIDLKHKNSTMRDPTLFRIIDHEHARTGTKYRLWPTFDFENSIMDGIQGVTHRYRTKEFELRTELQNYIQSLLGMDQTTIFAIARFNLKGVESSGRIIRELIEKKKLLGWDDPSLTTIVALKRRGFVPRAIKQFVLSTGLSKSESTLTWDDLIMHNKRILDSESNRYFFIQDPVSITVSDAPEQNVSLKLHPEFEDRGKRDFDTSQKFIIEKADERSIEFGEIVRLMDCLNMVKQEEGYSFDSVDHDSFKKVGKKIIHWLVDSKENVPVSIMMPDQKEIVGIAEPSITDVNEGDVIQFSRFGFCRLDNKKNMKFWFTHS